jgi:hypothetical protein
MGKAAIILSGAGGELDREEVDVDQDGDLDQRAAYNAIANWTLSIGDTITIVEV